MSNMQAHGFQNIGFVTAKLTDQQMKPIWDAVNKIQTDFAEAEPYNNQLAGNIEHEYSLESINDYVFELVMPIANAMNNTFDYMKSIDVLDRSCPLMMSSLWVNFQKKYEFNPLHKHSGVYSFVIWMKIPYDIQDELMNKSSRNAKAQWPAHFQFTYIDTLGKISVYSLPVDRTFENVICLFPASMHHQVYPFYTSDEYRISVAGNICLKSGN